MVVGVFVVVPVGMVWMVVGFVGGGSSGGWGEGKACRDELRWVV